jgi:hypothetical protein
VKNHVWICKESYKIASLGNWLDVTYVVREKKALLLLS